MTTRTATRSLRLATLLLSITSVAPLAAQDATGAVSLVDGRFIFGKPVVAAEGGVTIKFKAGDVFVPKRWIRDSFSTDAAVYKAKNAAEQKKIDQGMVLFQGKWMRKDNAVKAIKRLQTKLAARIEKQKEFKLWRNAKKVETRTFKYETNLPDEIFLNLKSLMEAYYKNFKKYWKRKTQLPNKPTIYLYADHGDYAQVSGASGGVVGWYHLLNNTLHVYWDRSDPDFTIDVLFHEANHMLSDMINGKFRYPHWIEEPMAEYYGASKWDPKKKKMSVGHVQAGRLTEVRYDIGNKKWMKLEDLIGARSYRSYTWGWSFCHFMMETPKYKKKWQKFYLALAHGKKVVREYQGPFKTVSAEEQKKQLKKFLGIKDFKELEKEWHAYVKNLKVNELEGLERAGRKLRTMGKSKEAREFLSKAVKMGAKSPYTYAAYAQILRRGSERQEAIKMIDKAIELDPLEPEFRYIKGRLLESIRKGDEAKKQFQLAAEIDPESWKYVGAAFGG